MPKFEIVTIEEAKKAIAEGKLKTRVNGRKEELDDKDNDALPCE
jgi:hypothetical protein